MRKRASARMTCKKSVVWCMIWARREGGQILRLGDVPIAGALCVQNRKNRVPG